MYNYVYHIPQIAHPLRNINLHTMSYQRMLAHFTNLDNAALCLPDGTDISCGRVSDGRMSGGYTSPGFPSYRHNLDCAYVIRVPSGYGIRLTLGDFLIEGRYAID